MPESVVRLSSGAAVTPPVWRFWHTADDGQNRQEGSGGQRKLLVQLTDDPFRPQYDVLPRESPHAIAEGAEALVALTVTGLVEDADMTHPTVQFHNQPGPAKEAVHAAD